MIPTESTRIASQPEAGGSLALVNCGPVLVVDAWERMALAACRALGRVGVEVGVAGHDRRADIVASSRYAERYDSLLDPQGPAAPYQAALHALVRQRGYVAIISCHDASLARLASIELPVPTLSVLDGAWHRLQDKARLAEVCGPAGIGYPLTERIETAAQGRTALQRLGIPAFVKGATSAHATPDRVAFARGATYARTVAEGEAAAAEMLGAGLPVVVQAAIPRAQKLNAVLLRRDGGSEVRYAHRVLREVPRVGGTGIALQALDPDRGDGADAIGLLEKICGAVGYEGVVQAEMYRTADDGALCLVDVNPRLWGSTWFAERLGLRIVERSVRAALGLPALPAPAYEAGRRFHTVSGELRWWLKGPGRWAGLGAIARTTGPRDVFEYVDPTDPVPTARYVAGGVRAQLAGRIAR